LRVFLIGKVFCYRIRSLWFNSSNPAYTKTDWCLRPNDKK